MNPSRVPEVTFRTRARDDAVGAPDPFGWRPLTRQEIVGGQRVVLFALHGAFTPSCSESHLPGDEDRYEEFLRLGIDHVVCLAANDAFVMFQGATMRDIHQVFVLPDGKAGFTPGTGMRVDRSQHGMGLRSWRCSMVVRDGNIEKVLTEPGIREHPDGVGVSVSDAPMMLTHLRKTAA